MHFAQRVFTVAGIFGLLIVPPVYFLEEYLGRQLPPANTHPEFYYGAIGATLAWQVVYLLIGQSPSRFRHVMPMAALAKGSFVVAVGVLFALERAPLVVMLAVVPDLLFVLLFLLAFVKMQATPKDWS